MTLRTRFPTATMCGLLGLFSVTSPQRRKAPTLEDVLQQLQANLDHYDARLPSLFCDEHVTSRVEPDLRSHDTVTDSVFRLQRTDSPNRTNSLVESREIREVNGKPPTSKNMNGPALLSGAFEGGLSVLSLDQAACMRYDLQRRDSNRPDEPYRVRFATVLTPQNLASCLLQESSTGYALIDPLAMQITHLEIMTPRHTIIPGDAFEQPVVGKRVLSLDYAPIVLGGEAFWLPSTITMRSTSGSGTFHMTVWSFEATYRKYHKLQVTSRIHAKPD